MESKVIKGLLVLSAIICLVIPTLSQDYSNDKRTLLTIGDEDISVAEFMRVYNKNNVKGEVLDTKTIEEYLDLYINFKLKVKEAEDLGMDTVESFVKELEGYRNQLTKPYFIDENVTEELITEAYERSLTDIRASHILIKVDKNAPPEDTLKTYEKIIEIKNKAENGEDFSKLAIEYSEDPSARDMKDKKSKRIIRKGNKGDLGYFTVFDMLYPFESAAYNTKEGEISDIIRTKVGYHIIKVFDKKEAMGKAQVAHVYVKIPENATTKDSAKSKEKIFEAYNMIQEGSSFKDAVIKYSDDRGSKTKEGKLPPFNSNRMVPEFIYEVSLLDTGEISEPFLTQYGWHIIKLLNIEKPGLFEDDKEMIRELLLKDSRSNKSKAAVIKKIKKDHRFREKDKRKEQLFNTLDSTILEGQWKIEKAEGLDKPLFKIGKEKYSQQEFAEYLAKKQEDTDYSNINVLFDNLYKDFVDKKCIEYYDQRLETFYPDFGLLMKEYRDGILLFELTNEKVWSKASEDTTGLKAFYENNKDKYMWGERVKASVYTIKEPINLEELKEKIDQGIAPEKILEVDSNYTNDTILFKSKIFAKGDNKKVDDVEWKEGNVKLYAQGNKVFIVEINNIVPPESKKFEEARGLVIADYQNYLETEWLKELKKKYIVKVNEKILSTLK